MSSFNKTSPSFLLLDLVDSTAAASADDVDVDVVAVVAFVKVMLSSAEGLMMLTLMSSMIMFGIFVRIAAADFTPPISDVVAEIVRAGADTDAVDEEIDLARSEENDG